MCTAGIPDEYTVPGILNSDHRTLPDTATQSPSIDILQYDIPPVTKCFHLGTASHPCRITQVSVSSTNMHVVVPERSHMPPTRVNNALRGTSRTHGWLWCSERVLEDADNICAPLSQNCGSHYLAAVGCSRKLELPAAERTPRPQLHHPGDLSYDCTMCTTAPKRCRPPHRC